MKRITVIDFTRGLVMIIMALDHTRDFMHVSSLTQSPTDLATTTPLLFFTRWITHLCAPVFVFLSGTAAFLSFKKEGISKSRKFLFSRGAWLVLLEFTLVNLALWFDIQFRNVTFEVIGAIGFGFIVLALVLKLPPKVVGVAGLFIIFGHDLLAYLPLPDHSLLKTVLSLLFNLTVLPLNPQTTFLMAYPPVPWLGIMLAGYWAGTLFEQGAQVRKKQFLAIGLSALAGFVVLRFINGYGDPAAWAIQKNGLFTFLSFINVSKYPPSLLFCLLMLGIMFLVMAVAEGAENTFTRLATVFGKVPLFYFLIHLYLVHALMLAMVFLQGFRSADLVFSRFHFGRPDSGSGLALWGIYITWLSVVAFMYPLCNWYGAYKAAHKEKRWLRYL